MLWSTQYYVYSANEVAAELGVPIVGKSGKRWGVSIAQKDWCLAGIEGTVKVNLISKATSGYNYLGLGGERFTKCSSIITSLDTESTERILYNRLDVSAPYGLGSSDKIRLIPFRSIAVDHTRFPRDTVIYVPKLRGLEFVDVDGARKAHDGYLFSADTGGAIKGNHIDFFTGTSTKNPFPSLITSTPTRTFEAHLISDTVTVRRLRDEHLIEKSTTARAD